jgi:putative DNA primase/helicase
MAVAREYVEHRCRHDGGGLTLRYWRGEWWQWQTSYWTEIENRAVRGAIYTFTENAVYATADGPKPWSPTSRKISDVADAITAITLLPEAIDQPCWIDGRENGQIVAVRNGLLNVVSRQLHSHTPYYFNQTAVPFDYDSDAADPVQWLEFLADLWPQEPEAIDVLAEWFGYVVSGRTDLHKILLMVGPTRGGKGAIARVLTALVGRKNVAGPTLATLGSGNTFALMPLIGKPLAIIADARFSGKGAGNVVERLLAISGEDAITVDRKYNDHWTGRIPSRLHIISNELPKLGDASSAIVGRFVVLMLTRSWLGKEDHDLEPRLQAELPAILNWSLDGLKRLTSNDGRFTRVPAADDAIVQMRDLASPVGAFVREKCEIGPHLQVAVDALYSSYKNWCELNEHRKDSMQVFGRNLHAVAPGIRKVRSRDGDARHNIYTGIGLKP